MQVMNEGFSVNTQIIQSKCHTELHGLQFSGILLTFLFNHTLYMMYDIVFFIQRVIPSIWGGALANCPDSLNLVHAFSRSELYTR